MTGYWLEGLKRQGHSPHHPSKEAYQVFRNVKDFGARGDGHHDDTDAINLAICDGQRCGEGSKGNDSSTISPALIYFPAGLYKISRPILSYYYTSLIGDATNRPTLKATQDFQGLALIDENPYVVDGWGRNWYTPQNNFFRSVSHLIIDLTDVDPNTECSGIHHQVSQATTLRHVHFALRPYGQEDRDANRPGQRGIFMENGSGGHLTSLSFTGGKIGIWTGNQQLTFQDCSFKTCHIAISVHWNWTMLFSRIDIQHCFIGFMMRVDHDAAAASVTCLDWKVQGVGFAFLIIGSNESAKGSLILSNVETKRTGDRIVTRILGDDYRDQKQFLLLTSHLGHIDGWTTTNWTWQGDVPSKDESVPRTGQLELKRPKAFSGAQGNCFYRPRPDYLNVPLSKFLSVRDHGAIGDGVHDDTAALQRVLDNASEDSVIYVPHGHYLLTSTLTIPPSIRMVGEVWPVFLGSGSLFDDPSNPRPVVQVGRYNGEAGSIEISECIFSTRGPCRGAIVLQWNLRHYEGIVSGDGPMEDYTHDEKNLPGMWDTHIRLGGFLGSRLDDHRFDDDKPVDEENAWACFLAWHLPSRSSGCFVNNWVWVADHTLDTIGDRVAGNKISILASRGILIESNPGPIFLWGGASEHFLLYQYQLLRAKNVFIGHAQTESPYFLGTGRSLPTQLVPKAESRWHDPTWPSSRQGDAFDIRSWGIRMVDCTDVHLYSPGLYSFFDNYSEEKIKERKCQRSLLSIENCKQDAGIQVVNLNTIGVKSMIDLDGVELVGEEAKRTGFTSMLGHWRR